VFLYVPFCGYSSVVRMALVMKFGGTSVGDAAAFENVARIVAAQRDAAPVVVVSAMSGVTDSLLAATTIVSLEKTFRRHEAAARELLSKTKAEEFVEYVNNASHRIAQLLETLSDETIRKAIQDSIVSFGETLSSALLAEVLNERGVAARQVDARHCIITDEEYTCAAPLISATFAHSQQELRPFLETGVIPVLGGFIGATLNGATTTLGRGGSDYTAAIIGAALSARRGIAPATVSAPSMVLRRMAASLLVLTIATVSARRRRRANRPTTRGRRAAWCGAGRRSRR